MSNLVNLTNIKEKEEIINEVRISIKICCLINTVEAIMKIDNTKMLNLYFFSIFLLDNVVNINKKQKLQCILGSKLIAGVSNL